MLEGILKGLLQWLYSLILEIVEYIANGLLEVFSMDLLYFEAAAPVVHDIIGILIACGWALLLGNLVFQAAKTMMTGLGFEGEDPRTLFTRTFVFGFFLLASRQICEIGLGLTSTVITMLRVPDSVTVSLPGENLFSIGASWLLVIIIGFVLMFQIVKLFFEIGERYFIVGFLTLMAPLAFAMGGSKNTSDIFKGWVRMYGSMCLMMVLNVVFLKILLSAMGTMPSDAGVLAWMVFVVAIARVGRKADDLIMRIGLNPAITGNGLGSRLPGMLSAMVFRTAASSVVKAASVSKAGSLKPPGAGSASPPSAKPGQSGQSGTKFASQQNTTAQNSPRTYTGAAGTATPGSATAEGSATTPGTAGMTAGPGQQNNLVHAAPSGTAGTKAASASAQTQAAPGIRGSVRSDTRQSAAQSASSRSETSFRLGTAGRRQGSGEQPPVATAMPPGGTAGIDPQQASSPVAKESRFTNIPPGARGTVNRPAVPGTAGMGASPGNTRFQQGGTLSSVPNTSHMNAGRPVRGESTHPYDQSQTALGQDTRPSAPAYPRNQGSSHSPGTAGTAARRSSVPNEKPSPAPAPPERGPGASDNQPASSSRQPGGNMTAPPPASTMSPPAPQERGTMAGADASRKTQKPSGTAGMPPANSAAFADKKPGATTQASAPKHGPPRNSGTSGISGKPNQGNKPNRRGKGGKGHEPKQ